MDSLTESSKNRGYLKNKLLHRNHWSGILFGIGMVAFIDEAVFHQLLHWHHFYDKSTTEIGLVSDGFFHAFSWLATCWWPLYGSRSSQATGVLDETMDRWCAARGRCLSAL